MFARHQVAITGLGIVAANGLGNDRFWQSLLENRSGIKRIESFDPSELPCQIAGEIRDFNVRDFVPTGIKANRLSRQSQLGLAAAAMAIKDAGLDTTMVRPPLYVVFGVSLNSYPTIEQNYQRYMKGGSSKINPSIIESVLNHGTASAMVELFKVPVKTVTVSTACASGLDATAYGADLIRSGKADLVLVGGADCAVSPFVIGSFCQVSGVSLKNDSPATASRPFDRDRDGGLAAEGSAVVVLENMQEAKARGARIYAEVLGYATQVDDTKEEPAGGLEKTMREALNNSGDTDDKVNFISAHAPSDPMVDRFEVQAIRRVFGAHADDLKVVSIKGATGNPLSAGGSMQVVATCQSFAGGIVPPTVNFEAADDGDTLDHVPHEPQRFRIRRAVVNTHGVGGINSSLVLAAV